MAYFNVCPDCGSNLDPGEVCDCAIKKCCICGDVLSGHGNNAMPVKDGRCCDRCNIMTVAPARCGNFGRSRKMLSTEEYIEKLTELGKLMKRDLLLELMDLKNVINLKDIPREQIKAFLERKEKDYERKCSNGQAV